EGQIDAHISPISPRVGGVVTAVYVNDNQGVEAGAVLFQIDPTDYKVAVERAKGELAEAEAAAQGARSSIPVTSIGASSNVSTAAAGVREVQAGVAVAQKGVATAQSRVKSAQARLQEADANATSAPEQVAVTRAQAGSAQARVQQRKAALDQALLNLQYATVKAPIAGVVGNKTVQVGQMAQAGQQMLALIALDNVWVTVNFK